MDAENTSCCAYLWSTVRAVDCDNGGFTRSEAHRRLQATRFIATGHLLKPGTGSRENWNRREKGLLFSFLSAVLSRVIPFPL